MWGGGEAELRDACRRRFSPGCLQLKDSRPRERSCSDIKKAFLQRLARLPTSLSDSVCQFVLGINVSHRPQCRGQSRRTSRRREGSHRSALSALSLRSSAHAGRRGGREETGSHLPPTDGDGKHAACCGQTFARMCTQALPRKDFPASPPGSGEPKRTSPPPKEATKGCLEKDSIQGGSAAPCPLCHPEQHPECIKRTTGTKHVAL